MRHERMVRVVAGVVAGMLGSAAWGWTVVPSERKYVRDLGGEWRFKLEQKEEKADGKFGGGPTKFVPPATLEAFEKVEYREGKEWGDIKVPGNWEMQGWSVATYNQPDNVIGLYRLEFEVPKSWDGRVVKINFDGVQNAAEVYLNGRPVKVDEPTGGKENFHQGGHVAFQADLTPAVKFGEKNLLAVRVYKNHIGVDLDTGDYFFLGGIHREVTLFSVPQTRIEDLTIKTTVAGGGKAEVNVDVEVVGKKEGMKVEGKLKGLDVPPVVTDAGNGLAWNVEGAEYWSAEKPKLYDLVVELKDGEGKVVEVVERRVGIREVTVDGGVLKVNHVPVKFTGMCRHDNWPTKGTYNDEDVWRKDIELMKEHNINAIRTSHYPYGSGFYDLCDELGMYVMDEVSACWVPTDQERLAPHFAQQAREMVRRDKNHPSVIVWAVGNENKPGLCNQVAAEEIGKMDDTRPRLVSWLDGDKVVSAKGDGKRTVELDDRHYTNPPAIAKANEEARRKGVPMLYLENPNDWEVRNGADWGSLDLWGEIIRRTWDVVWASEHVPGSFLWEWADRAVADTNERKLYDYFPKTGINLVKVKGQVDAFRNPRPGLYHVKMAYAPVTVDVKPVRMEGNGVVVAAQNRYSFTDLAEVRTSWRLMRGGERIESGRQKVSLAPLSKGELKFEVPADELARADGMQVEFEHQGRHVATYEVKLREVVDEGPKLVGVEGAGGVRFPRFNLVAVKYGESPKTGWRTAFRERGRLANIRVGGKAVGSEAELCAMLLGEVGEMEADVVMEGGEVVGRLRAGMQDGRFGYRVEWLKERDAREGKQPVRVGRGTEAATDVQELGWVFVAGDEDEERFSWRRQAPLSWYPEDHVGRPAGTARPETMEQEITRITRADAFDFGATKYACDWATLADRRGNGIGVRFDAKQRHQVRGGLGTGGIRELVVNLHCCPPRDLSSGIVPDLYFTLDKGQAVEGAFEVGRVGAGSE